VVKYMHGQSPGLLIARIAADPGGCRSCCLTGHRTIFRCASFFEQGGCFLACSWHSAVRVKSIPCCFVILIGWEALLIPLLFHRVFVPAILADTQRVWSSLGLRGSLLVAGAVPGLRDE